MSNENPPSVLGQKRKSRFDTDIIDPVLPEQKRLNLEVSVAAAKAAEMSKEIAAKMKLVTSLLGSKTASEKKAEYRPLLLDAQGREIDEKGNLVKRDLLPVKTLAANLAASQPPKKKENPYLAHWTQQQPAVTSSSTDLATPLSTPADSANPSSSVEVVVDERLPIAEKRRDTKAKKSLQFVEAGHYVKEAQKIAEKEERKMIAGYASGRKQLEKGTSSGGAEGSDEEHVEGTVIATAMSELVVPPPLDPIVPAMEWWDEAFLPKTRRDARKISKAATELDEYDAVNVLNVKTYKFVQHPIPIKPLGAQSDSKSLPVLPMYLTKKERKKLRKAQRAEREREKRDKMMLGLIQAPEPKLKLSNFMKILGDQAVADPSKMEMKVIQQMQKRILNHEMRNQSNKLTPQQRRMKKMKKLQEDVSKGVTVAVFRITDFSCLKYRFKVDITAQQYFLSGLVLLCPEEKLNLVVVEGGPKGIRKFTKMMTARIAWNIFIPTNTITAEEGEDGAKEGGDAGLTEFQVVTSGEEFNYATTGGAEGGVGGDEVEKDDHNKGGEQGGEDSDDDDSEDDDDDDDEEERGGSLVGSGGAINVNRGGVGSSAGYPYEARPNPDGRCDLLWQGILPKRLFTGFKFQEVKSTSAAKKLLEGKNVAHYWDMVTHAQAILDSSKSDDIFDLLNL